MDFFMIVMVVVKEWYTSLIHGNHRGGTKIYTGKVKKK